MDGFKAQSKEIQLLFRSALIASMTTATLYAGYKLLIRPSDKDHDDTTSPSSSSSSSKGHLTYGIYNEGNTCYINCVLQVLMGSKL